MLISSIMDSDECAAAFLAKIKLDWDIDYFRQAIQRDKQEKPI